MASGARRRSSGARATEASEDSGEEGGAMAVVEVVAGFEVLLLPGLAVEQAGVEQAVGGVEHPDGEEHGDDGGEREGGCGWRRR